MQGLLHQKIMHQATKDYNKSRKFELDKTQIFVVRTKSYQANCDKGMPVKLGL